MMHEALDEERLRLGSLPEVLMSIDIPMVIICRVRYHRLDGEPIGGSVYQDDERETIDVTKNPLIWNL